MMMKISQGNKRFSIVVACQNLPGGLSLANKQICVDQLIKIRKLHIRALCEPRHSELQQLSVPGYSLLKGDLRNFDDPRLNVFIKDDLTYTRENFLTDVPAIHLKCGDQGFIFAYREWRLNGDEKTGSYGDQLQRWITFVDKWRKITGRLIVIGDMNLEYWRSETQQHRDQIPMKNYLFKV